MKRIIFSISLLLSTCFMYTKHIHTKKIAQISQEPTIEISYGELIDKITILEIKTEKITDPKKLEHVKTELKVLLETYFFYVDQTEEVQLLKEKLKEINTRLWEIEDAIREKDAAQMFDEEFIMLAKSVYRTNDERYTIKKKINKLCNSRLIEEKQYQTYKN